MTDRRSLVSRMADELDHYRQLVTDDRREVHALAKEARVVLAADGPAVPNGREPAYVVDQPMSPPDWRGLCEELANTLERAQKALRFEGGCSDATDNKRRALIDRARALLAQPEPEVVGPSDEELLELWQGWNLGWDPQKGTVLMSHPAEYARAVLARWGRPAPAPAGERQAAPVPVAVSERPWEREGWCHPEERWAWFYNRRVGWRDAIPPESLKPPTLFPYTHSLPFNALPLPNEDPQP